MDIDVIQVRWVDPEGWLDLQKHVVLVNLRVHGVDLPLTKSVVQCVDDGVR